MERLSVLHHIYLVKSAIISAFGQTPAYCIQVLASSILYIVLGLGKQTKGSFVFDGCDIMQAKDRKLSEIRNKKIGFVFQNFNLLPRQSALENVELPLLYAGVGKRERRQRAKAALEKVGLAERMMFKPTQLSGGQKQRLCIARALTVEPKVLLLDEPCSALDVKASAKIEELLKNLKERYTIVIVPHNLAQAKRIADDVAFFQNGRLVETKDAETFWKKPECEETKEFLKG